MHALNEKESSSRDVAAVLQSELSEGVHSEEAVIATKKVIAWLSGENVECTNKDQILALKVHYESRKKRGDNVCQA